MRSWLPITFKEQQSQWSALLLSCLLMAVGAVSYAAPKSATHTIVINGMQFSPPILEVHAGDTVIWKNKDPFPHTATSDKDGFNSGNILPERSWKFVAKKRGTFSYSCALHETMKGSLVVK